MFKSKPNPVQADHEELIAELKRKMLDVSTTPAEYDEYLKQLERLYKLHDPHKDQKKPAELRDWIPVIGSIGGVLVIIVYESLGHSLTSKAVSFIRKV